MKQERDPGKLLKSLADTMQQRQFPFHHAVFTPPDSQYGKLKAAATSSTRDVSWQHTLCQAWKKQVPQHPQVTYARPEACQSAAWAAVCLGCGQRLLVA